MVVFSHTETSLSLLQIFEIEQYVGLFFPEEYKAHLLKHNGGRCDPNVFYFNENGSITNSHVDWFLAIYNGKFDNLKTFVDIYKIKKKRLPSHILPIAHDPGGNLICISCKNDDMGSIYFWDHEKEVDYKYSDDHDYSNLYFIAKSFNEFIEGLQEVSY